MGHRSPYFSRSLLLEAFLGSAVKGHIAPPLREQRPPLVSLPTSSLSPYFASLCLHASLSFLCQHHQISNLNNVTQMEKKASCPFFPPQSLAVSSVLKVRREKSPGCSLPTTLTYSLDKLWETQHIHIHYNM